MHYFRSVRLHKEAFGAIVQTNVESITENIGDVVSSKPIELQQSPSPALLKEIMKLEAFKDIKQHTVSTTVTESQLTIKYLKDKSTMLALCYICSKRSWFEETFFSLMIYFDINVCFWSHQLR